MAFNGNLAAGAHAAVGSCGRNSSSAGLNGVNLTTVIYYGYVFMV